ncbi:DUF222 domain-containing protein [Mycolicibacterium neoaurum]|uniref:DUF222 domain-containing protein n=1 Tax=Mycolicibacterium neoaurum TaxID=1795 RepID=UPI00248C919B|nr:DUF222 domain-containing protein [Mycolicibacterium neoaurum]WBS08318.1 DUF222 domain-containing protein [Mycolicibacterium neoaurum]
MRRRCGEELCAALDPLCRPVPLPDGSPDPRPITTRRAEALGQVLRTYLSQSRRPMSGGVLPHVTLIRPGAPGVSGEAVDRLGFGGPVSAATAELIACDATLTSVIVDHTVVPLDVGRAERLFTPAIRKALADTAELLALQSERERRARADAVIDARIQAAIMQRATAHEIGAKSWADVLITRMRLSAREAATRVRRAEHLAPRRCVTGEMLDPAMPLCARALADGDISEGHVTVIAEAVRMAATHVDAANAAELERILVPVARVSRR